MHIYLRIISWHTFYAQFEKDDYELLLGRNDLILWNNLNVPASKEIYYK
jgi:hypothetical protein